MASLLSLCSRQLLHQEGFINDAEDRGIIKCNGQSLQRLFTNNGSVDVLLVRERGPFWMLPRASRPLLGEAGGGSLQQAKEL